MSNLASLALLAFVCLGLFGLTCWALLWIWTKREYEPEETPAGLIVGERITLAQLIAPGAYSGSHLLFVSCGPGEFRVTLPWLDSEPFTGDLAWPKCPRAICDWSQDA